jgi:hypothetical protein
LNTKKLKDFEPSPWWQETWIYNKLWNVYHKIVYRPIYRLKHYYGWYKVLKNDYSWDSHSIYSILLHKLVTVRKAMLHGYAIQEEQHMRALSLAIKLAEKLNDHEYNKAYLRHERKWGELETWITPIQNSTNFSWHSMRPKAIFEKDLIQEREEQSLVWRADDARKQRDKRKFFNILAKYQGYWWE